MKKLDDTIKRVKEMQLKANDVLISILRDNEGVICNMVSQIQQYEKGIKGDGSPISPDYTGFTISVKISKGQPTDRVTLENEGDFHNSFYIEFGNESFVIKATDWKYEKLKRLYGEGIMSLTAEHKKELIEYYIKPEYIKRLKQ